MSAATLQRLVVRMLYDPELVKAVHANLDGIPAGAELGAAERAWLLAAERRAFGIDPLRRTRTLRALIEELPVSSALAAAVLGDVRELDAFFSSALFHAAIQHRRALFAAYGDWLAPHAASTVVIEAAVARVRRVVRGGGTRAAAGYRRAPWVEVVEQPAGTLELLAHVRGVLARNADDPVAALLDPSFALGRLPAMGGGRGWILVEGRDGEAALTAISGELGALLSPDAPRSRGELLAAVREMGVEGDEAEEVVDGLVSDGLLVAS